MPTTTQVRDQHANKKQTPMWSLAEARANKRLIDWTRYTPPMPEVHRPPRVQELRPGRAGAATSTGRPFFQTWDLAGPFPPSCKDEVVGDEARRVFADGQAHAQETDRWPLAHGQRRGGLYPANTVDDDDIELYTRREPHRGRHAPGTACASRPRSRR